MSATNHLEELLVELAEKVNHRYFGRYRGTVTEVGDGEHLGQVRAKVPALYGDNESPWALPAVPFAGSGHGFLMLPVRDDGVWFECENGDLGKPLWTAFWWADGEVPSPGGPKRRVLVSPGGLKIVLDDADNKLQLIHPGGATLTLSDQEIALEIGPAKLVLSASGLAVNGSAFTVRAT